MPTDGLPLSAPVRIAWDRYAIPFIEADSDMDAATALGMVHAHLRLGQMEVMRRLALGRLAEMLGPAALEMDHSLRMLGFDRAVPAIIARMPATTLAWVEAFIAGINHYMARTPRLPPDFTMLGLQREPWSVAHILSIGRLASADCNWFVLFNLLRLRHRADWPQLWAGLADHEGAAFWPLQEKTNALADLATRASRSGSNALAIAGARSASRAALMAADPHLNITIPNVWLVAGVQSPSLHATGLMIPGLPFIAIGRNQHIAWSGTALQASSSDLFDARDLPVTTRRETFRSRLGPTVQADIRETVLGPLVSDSRLLGAGQPLALKWMGHHPSDEVTAWLGVARAASWEEFAAAAEGMAVLPRRPQQPPTDAVLGPEDSGHWDSLIRSSDLPRMVDPAGGVLASANEKPRHAAYRVGMFFSAHDRHLRLHRLAQKGDRLDLGDLAGFQHDVHSEAAMEIKTWLGRRLDSHPLAHILEQWDGFYDADSRGAAAFELLMGRLHRFAHGDDGQATYWASWNPTQLMRHRLATAPPEPLKVALGDAAHGVMHDLRDGAVWGDIHRLHLAYPLPGLGRLARFADLPTGGGNETLMKTAHGLAFGRHSARFGANARFLTDMADPDRTSVVLLGGQDGWFGTANFLDQVPLWRAGHAIPLPLRPQTARARAAQRMVLRP
ncbi:MAG: penicillin acylase family protein [Rhodospirillaceae bacterium]|nr:penicillin acylase family protein [Rhodospirillales bacterium]